MLAGLRICFRNFSPPPGLVLDFTSNPAMSPDDHIRSFFTFLPPGQFISGFEVHGQSQTNSVEVGADGASPTYSGDAPTTDAQPNETRPLRTTRFASSPKHVLAHIIKTVYTHLRGPTCKEAARRLDGATRFLLRNNSKAALMEPLLIYSLIQGNAASAIKFQNVQSSLENTSDDLLQLRDVPQNAMNSSPQAGVYPPLLLVSYVDLGTVATEASTSCLVTFS